PGVAAGAGGPLRLQGGLPRHGDHPSAAWAEVLGAVMDGGACTPEQLETLLEDAFMLQDHQALAQLFHPAAILVAGWGLPEARGHQQIAHVAAQLWASNGLYVADPR